MINRSSTVEIITTDDLEPGVVLTELFYNQLETMPKLIETTILNNTGFSVTSTDCYGVVTTFHSRQVSNNVYDKLKLPLDFKGVVVVDKRIIHPGDLVNTINYYNKFSSLVKFTPRVNRIQNQLINLDNINRLREYYIIYAVPVDLLRVDKCVYLKSPNMLLSIPGCERKAPLLDDDGGMTLGVDNVSINTLGMNIVYYSKEPDSIYVNLLGVVNRVDSIHIDDMEEGVLVTVNNNGLKEEVFIRPEAYQNSNIFKTSKEAKYNLSMEAILSNRKMELEFAKTETAFITNALTEASNIYKNKMDLSSKVLQSLLEKDKQMSLKAMKNKEPNALDEIKKLLDIVSMIRKII